MKEPLYLLDGYSVIYRSYFAFIRNPLRNGRGENTSAIFGFLRTLLSILKEYDPKRFAVVLDSIEETFRHTQYEAYKATRDKTPDDLHAQIPRIEAILEALKVPKIRSEGYEADDVMATFARRCREEGRACYVISGDKDLLQLVDGPVRILKPTQKAGLEELDREGVYHEWGVYPEQILDYLSLVGDSSDNVPGVRGIGAKTAAKLLNDFGTLDKIYENLDALSSKSQREKLEEGRESAYMSKELITLAYDAPLSLSIDELELSNLEVEAAVPLLQQENMQSVIDELREALGGGPASRSDGEPGSEGHPTQPAARGVSGAEPVPGYEPLRTPERLLGKGSYETVTSMDRARELLREAREAGRFAFDSETDALSEMVARPVGFSISWEAKSGFYFPLVGPEGPVLPREEIRPLLKELLEDPRCELVGQNLKYDYKVFSRWGIEMASIYFDTMIAAWLIDSAANGYGMDSLARRYLGYETVHYAELFAGKGAGETPFSEVPLETAGHYAAEDADITWRLYELFAPEIERRGYQKLFHQVEMPLVALLGRMELRGITLQVDELESYSAELASELRDLEKAIYELCGREFNIGSTKQLQEVLFQERKLQPVKKTKTGFSTDNAVLQQLAREDPVPERILRHRQLSKLKSTYVDALPKLVNPETRRLHTHYQQTGTATGRLSSKDPNLQNIPIRDEEGRRIRRAFVAPPEWRIVSADYSQIELVVLAHLSDDPGLKSAFFEGVDVHRRTGALIFGVETDQVTPEQRRIAKTINFGVMYGMSSFRLSNELSIPRREAEAFIQAYFATYSRIREFIDHTVAEAEKSGRVRTLLGRERPLPDINSRNRNVKSGQERIAVNTPIQGTAADIVKLAMLNVDERLTQEKMRSRILLQVHDELILEAPEAEVDLLTAILMEEMSTAVELSVPLRVNVESGTNWGELH
ncbi:MAG: DNA polymerase I [Spirochaetaceae bacterium]